VNGWHEITILCARQAVAPNGAVFAFFVPEDISSNRTVLVNLQEPGTGGEERTADPESVHTQTQRESDSSVSPATAGDTPQGQ